jgi:hypothetical protein
MNNGEKLEQRDIYSETKLGKWFDNFWYHYKWPSIIVCFFVIVFAVCTLQMCNKQSYDISIVYAGPYNVDSKKSNDIKSVFDFTIPEDFDGNGSKSAQLVSYLIFTQEQIEKIEEKGEEYIDRSYVANESKNFFNYVSTEAGICFIDPSLYQTLKESDRLISITDTVGFAPEGLIDDYGVRLSETELYEEYAILRELPADTVVCMLRKQLSKKQAVYDEELATFKAILAYGETAK